MASTPPDSGDCGSNSGILRHISPYIAPSLPEPESETTGDISTAENCKQKTCLLLYSPSHHKTFIITAFFPIFYHIPVLK